MSKNVIVNDTQYSGVSLIQVNTTDGGVAQYRDVDEISVRNFELKGSFTANTTGYIYQSGTIDQAILTPSYNSGIIVDVVDSADDDWTDNSSGTQRLIVFYTVDKYILIATGYRSGTGEQTAGIGMPTARDNAGAGNAITTSFGNTFSAYLNAGQTVKKYEIELDSSIVQALMYFG